MAASDHATMPVNEPNTDAFKRDLVGLLTPMVARCDEGIQQALNSQAVLSQQLERVATQLQHFLGSSQLPSLSPHAQKLTDTRRRLSEVDSTLEAVQERLERVQRMADQLREKNLRTGQGDWPSLSGEPAPASSVFEPEVVATTHGFAARSAGMAAGADSCAHSNDELDNTPACAISDDVEDPTRAKFDAVVATATAIGAADETCARGTVQISGERRVASKDLTTLATLYKTSIVTVSPTSVRVTITLS